MNFDFLKPFPEFAQLYRDCTEAERALAISPNMCATAARRPMESLVRLIYRANVGDDTGKTVFELLVDPQFEQHVGDETIIGAMHIIRQTGNAGTHGNAQVSLSRALDSLEQLHYLMGETCITLGLIDDYPSFVNPLSAPASRKPSTGSQPPEQTGAPAQQLKPDTQVKQGEQAEVAPEALAKLAQRLRFTRFDCRKDRDELANKKMFISACLCEAGWPIATRPNQPVPSSAGIDCMVGSGTKVDYILYGRDNRPLAVIRLLNHMHAGP